jgi:hypothetical protein
VNGYDEIDVNDSVTVRGEIARLSRLYERAVRTNTANNPDLYQSDGGLSAGVKLRQNAPTATAVAPGSSSGPVASSVPAPAAAPPADPDASPATSVPVPKKEEVKEVPKEEPKDGKSPAAAESSNGAAKAPEPAKDPDAAPSTEDSKGKGPTSE